ncbi:transporter substrate-binding domain-containing protein [Pelomonas aquatica]|uniref:transporter substrate-binding domain-containing protein n=1 Tax=Pelomonas aquatica TaxID=431058 RepID=UPI00227C0E9C|nr:transporter substrate-binding domain-containing protein [Pelomonas aquatica]
MWGAWAAVLLAVPPAGAGCQRPIDVPMAPLGLSVSFDGERAGGIYPALLRELAASTGCVFQVHRVPRARLLKLFESAQADLLIPAAASPARDRDGEFVPLIQVRASLLTLSHELPAPRSLAELLAQPDFKLAVVRGFTFGAAYDAAVATLRERKRLVEEADVAGAARALRQGLAQATIMMTATFVSTLAAEADLAPLLKQVRSEALEELGWAESGVYLSRQRLGEADRRTLRQAFGQAAKAGRVWQLFNDGYPPGSLGGNVRPL